MFRFLCKCIVHYYDKIDDRYTDLTKRYPKCSLLIEVTIVSVAVGTVTAQVVALIYGYIYKDYTYLIIASFIATALPQFGCIFASVAIWRNRKRRKVLS